VKKLFLFMNVSLDGYFEGPGHDISWAGPSDFDPFSSEQDQGADAVLLGHQTYLMMERYWPTPQAKAAAPKIAQFMNKTLKVAVSHKPFRPDWDNVRVISDNVIEEVRKLKEGPGKSIAIFGSNTLCVSLMPAGLIDEFQLLVHPVVLGRGTSLFQGLPAKAELTLTDTRRFRSGHVMLIYVSKGA